MLNKEETKLVKQYIAYPDLLKVAIIAIFGSFLAWVIIEFICTEYLFADGLYNIGLYALIGIIIFYITLALYFYFKLKNSSNNLIWQNITSRINSVFIDRIDDEEDGVSLSDIAKVKNKAKKASKSKNALITQAYAALDIFNLKKPKVTLMSLVMMIVPVLLLTGIYTPRFIDLNNQKMIAFTKIDNIMQDLNEAFKDETYSIYYDTPLVEYYDYGYYFSAYFDYDMNSYISLSINNDGTVDYVGYNIYFDESRDRQEVLKEIEDEFTKYNTLLLKAGLDDSRHLNKPVFSDIFEEDFINSNDDIHYNVRNTSINVYFYDDHESHFSYNIY